MSGWTVKAHPLAEAELIALPADMRTRFLRIAELLETFGPEKVGFPHIRPLEGKLWEMRFAGQGRHRPYRVCRRSWPNAAGVACFHQEDANHTPRRHRNRTQTIGV